VDAAEARGPIAELRRKTNACAPRHGGRDQACHRAVVLLGEQLSVEPELSDFELVDQLGETTVVIRVPVGDHQQVDP
jgi:hypothetical protein